MTGENKSCPSFSIGYGTPDRCSPESDRLSDSAPSLSVPRIAESTTQSTSSTYDTSEAKRESQGFVAPLRGDAPWNVRFQKTEEILEDGFCEEKRRLGIGRPQKFDIVFDHFGCVKTSNISVAASMNVNWEIDVHVNVQYITSEQGEGNLLSAAERISRRDYDLIGFAAFVPEAAPLYTTFSSVAGKVSPNKRIQLLHGRPHEIARACISDNEIYIDTTYFHSIVQGSCGNTEIEIEAITQLNHKLSTSSNYSSTSSSISSSSPHTASPRWSPDTNQSHDSPSPRSFTKLPLLSPEQVQESSIPTSSISFQSTPELASPASQFLVQGHLLAVQPAVTQEALASSDRISIDAVRLPTTPDNSSGKQRPLQTPPVAVFDSIAKSAQRSSYVVVI
ncbi:uncharacterized protein Bfra_000019 [Botrytis fragariae]|uniref:Uncharacterized protein n=1 Tax=Botrytis fragariae TaxID=1964551 RepID=A0A8H6B2I0_9HELO|nr:uncharacterized protein Bfra_000019 [Botrytis fragariae]KAF5877857.1 hypothetical protein Bfra_000019 [Botrytis fragariae]